MHPVMGSFWGSSKHPEAPELCLWYPDFCAPSQSATPKLRCQLAEAQAGAAVVASRTHSTWVQYWGAGVRSDR